MRHTILIIEDDADIRRILDIALSEEGYTVVTAENGQEGLDWLARIKPDLILLDMMMPVMSGSEVLHVLQQQKSRIPVIVMTVGEREQEEAWMLRVEHVLMKPFEYDDLLNVIDALVKSTTTGEVMAVLAR